MKGLTEYLNESILNEANDSKFIVATGKGYQSLWNNSKPSVTYFELNEFSRVDSATKYATQSLRNKSSKTHVGQGGIPGGYDYPIADVWEVPVDVNVDLKDFDSSWKFEKAKFKQINFSGSKGVTEDKIIELTAEFNAIFSLTDLSKFEPDSKDWKRAEDLYKGNYKNYMKSIPQLVSISDPQKFIRRLIALTTQQFIEAKNAGVYYRGLKFNHGIETWIKAFSPSDLTWKAQEIVNEYKGKWGIDLDNGKYGTLQNFMKTTLLKYMVSKLESLYPDYKLESPYTENKQKMKYFRDEGFSRYWKDYLKFMDVKYSDLTFIETSVHPWSVDTLFGEEQIYAKDIGGFETIGEHTYRKFTTRRGFKYISVSDKKGGNQGIIAISKQIKL